MAVPHRPGTSSPDRDAYFRASIPIIDRLLLHPLSPDVIEDAFRVSTPLFFVDSAPVYFVWRNSITFLHKKATAHLVSPGLPARRDWDCFRRGDALSLFGLLRLNECFIELCNADEDCNRMIGGVGLAAGLTASSIVPSVLRFDRSAYADIVKEFKFGGTAVADHIPRSATERNPQLLMRDLTQGYEGRGGARVGAYRVTQRLAESVADAASKATDGKLPATLAFERLFDPSPRRGPGQGSMTKPLPVDQGNAIKAVGAVR
jgi:hypothetical protein